MEHLSSWLVLYSSLALMSLGLIFLTPAKVSLDEPTVLCSLGTREIDCMFHTTMPVLGYAPPVVKEQQSSYG